jgi:hypothetical protein
MPDSRQRRVLLLIKEHGGKLVRQGKHKVYGFPSGMRFVVSSTPSDVNAWRQSLACLRRLLGDCRPERSATARTSRHNRKRVRLTRPRFRQFQFNPELAPTSMPSAIEKALIEHGDFETLMLAQGVKRLEIE